MSEHAPIDETPERKEAQEHQPPAIYVMSMEDWARGRDHAEWIRADRHHEAMQGDVNELLAHSLVPGANRWEVHDQQGFYGLDVGDMSLERISAIGQGIAKHGEPLAMWVGYRFPDVDPRESVDEFEQAYKGTYKDLEDFRIRGLGELEGLEITAELVAGWQHRYYLLESEAGVYAYDLPYEEQQDL